MFNFPKFIYEQIINCIESCLYKHTIGWHIFITVMYMYLYISIKCTLHIHTHIYNITLCAYDRY